MICALFGAVFLAIGAYSALWPVPEIVFSFLRMPAAAEWWREFVFAGTDVSVRGACYLIWTSLGLPFGALCVAFGSMLIRYGVGQ